MAPSKVAYRVPVGMLFPLENREPKIPIPDIISPVLPGLREACDLMETMNKREEMRWIAATG